MPGIIPMLLLLFLARNAFVEGIAGTEVPRYARDVDVIGLDGSLAVSQSISEMKMRNRKRP